eukprot:1195885-Prorocentrum_minimum.AAC.3
MDHFGKAAEIDANYCEPRYWMGLTLINSADKERFMDGVAFLEQVRYPPDANQPFSITRAT